MNIATVAIRNARRRPLRTALLLAVVALAAATLFSSAVLLAGLDRSLRQGAARLGADILVVPENAEAQVRSALLAGEPGLSFLPRSTVDRVRSVKGVSAATPQLFLKPRALPCCYDVSVFLIAFDPATDLTIQPWLEEHLGRPLSPDQVITGGAIPAFAGDMIPFFGTMFTVAATLERTGMDVFDRSVFLTLEAAYRMAEASGTRSSARLPVGRDDISAVLVRVEEGTSPDRAAIEIEFGVPGVRAVTSRSVLAPVQRQIRAAGRAVIVLGAVLWTVVLLVLALVFTMIANERRREIGILRALGATRLHVSLLLGAESSLVSLLGSCIGIAAGGGILAGGWTPVRTWLGLPALLPDALSFALPAIGVVLLAVLAGLAAVLLPARAISRQDPFEAIRRTA